MAAAADSPGVLRRLEAVRPISRGGQAPTSEASFQVPRSQPPLRMDILKVRWDLERFTYRRELQQLRDQNLLDKQVAPENLEESTSSIEPAQPPVLPLHTQTPARDEEAELIEAAALARKHRQEQSDDSDMDSAQEQDESVVTSEPPDADVWFV